MHPDDSSDSQATQPSSERRKELSILFALWLVIFFASLFTPPLLDDADATHAQAARSILAAGDWVTLHVNGIRYLEKPPLPYWLVAISFRCFGFNSFAAHLPGALAVLGLALLGYGWASRSFSRRAGLYTGLATLTTTGVFLFTRVFIPDVLLSLLVALALFAFYRAFGGEERRAAPERFAYLFWISLALAVLTKGLVVLVLFVATSAIYLPLAGKAQQWRRLHPFAGAVIFLTIAAPWHILASLRNTGGENGHGFLWFYFVNEHVLRFLGHRVPRDYNKLPAALYWSLHLVWLFPWSFFSLPAIALLRRKLKQPKLLSRLQAPRSPFLLLSVFAAVVVVFFSLSTNQEYYTFPAYLPLLMLIAVTLVETEQNYENDATLHQCIVAAHALFAMVGAAVALALATALFRSRGFAPPSDIGVLLTHRGVSNYTLSMASFFDLTGPSFAALRLPARLAVVAFAAGPVAAWRLRVRRWHLASTLTIALTGAAFLIAAHIALARFAPMLSSKDFADRIRVLEDTRQIEPGTQIALFGDQAYGSSIPFYLNQQVKLVDGRTTSMYFGSTFPDAPSIFLTQQQLSAEWGLGPRKIIFIPQERSADATRLLGDRVFVIAGTSGKLLVTDRPLAGKH